jgi:sigma-B regulation protein RsbU (phosphoserine phosphatase)
MKRERILIIDDNDVNRQVLVAILRKEGYELLQASSGEHALELAVREHPDLALLDIMMPVMDGYEVCRQLEANPATTGIPVIFLSALAETESKVRGLELGAVDYITKPFDQTEVLARVRTHLKIRRLTEQLLAANRELMEKQRTLEVDLRAAGDIQRSLIPKAPPAVDGIEVAWRFQPCERIGGDVFNVYTLNNTHLVAYVVDISGHGVPAAMVTVSVSQSLSPYGGMVLAEDVALQGLQTMASPQQVLTRLDQEYPIERFEKYFTICYGVLSLADGRLRYSRAGHPLPIVQRADGTLERLEAGGPIIGLGGILPFEEQEVQLCPGDRVFFYTDGIVECENAAGEPYGEDRFLQQLQHARHLPLEGVCEQVMRSLAEFDERAVLPDDITLVALGWRGAMAA